MSDAVRAAFCPLYFSSNGGSFKSNGLPIFADDEDIRGNCDKPYDCAECSLLQDWLTALRANAWVPAWECEQCLKDVALEEKRSNVERVLPGFYQTGRDPETDPFPLMPAYVNDEVATPMLSGCTRCGWQTSFLQLVLRRQR